MIDFSGQVECRSEWTYAQQPRALEWGGRRLEVARVLRQWLAPDGRHFLVACANAALFELIYHEGDDTWRVAPGGC